MPRSAVADIAKNIDSFEVQQLLKDLCYNPGLVDGVWGDKTERAVINFYEDHSGKYDQPFDFKDLRNLRKAKQDQDNKSGACASKSERADTKVTEYKGWSIPQYVKPDPNLATLRHYFSKDFALISDPAMGWYKVKPAGNHQEFDKNLQDSNFIKIEFEITIQHPPLSSRYSTLLASYAYSPIASSTMRTLHLKVLRRKVASEIHRSKIFV